MSVHANCDHAATKTARAACRRQNKGMTAPAVTVADVKVETEPTSLAFTWDRSQAQGKFAEGDEWQSLGGTPIYRENWKEYRELVMELIIETLGVYGDDTRHAKIIAWGEKFMTYVSESGHTTRVPAERVRYAFVA